MRPLNDVEKFWAWVCVALILFGCVLAFVFALARNAYGGEYTGTQYILDSHNLYIEDHDYMEHNNRQRELDTNWRLQQQINDLERDSNYDPHPDPAPIRPAPVQNFRIVD